ncbi:MAG: hypothetical protein NZM27_08615 [Acetobacteraceae bacterium]|nr:hypothetical protein [Acetobacteraceae bacterium]MDW8399215.1 hypothetical protein [Acetobacteraceae bacterium]
MDAQGEAELIRINGIAVMPDGAVAPVRPERPVLRFAWRGRGCSAELTPEGLLLSAWAGRVPSSALSPSRRGAVLAAMPEIARRLPEGWRLRLSPDHRILVQAASPGAFPAPMVALLSQLVRFALALDPLCDALDAAGAEPAHA